MPSWQARIATVVIRAVFKRRPTGSLLANAKLVRDKFRPPEFLFPARPMGVKVTNINVDEIRGEWVESSENAGRVIYYLHGGGYVACSPATHRGFTSAIAKATGAKVFALDYRLAPEHPFPAALDDAVAGYKWLIGQGIDPNQIVFGGDSAGGGLALATLISLRDSGEALPRAAFLLSPWTDLAVTGESIDANEKSDAMFYAEMIRKIATVYLGESEPNNPLASPLYADLAGLPPLLIYVSDSEALRDDSVRVAEKAKACGVHADLRVWKDLVHVWPVFVAFGMPEAKKATAEIAEFIDEAFIGRFEAPNEKNLQLV